MVTETWTPTAMQLALTWLTVPAWLTEDSLSLPVSRLVNESSQVVMDGTPLALLLAFGGMGKLLAYGPQGQALLGGSDVAMAFGRLSALVSMVATRLGFAGALLDEVPLLLVLEALTVVERTEAVVALACLVAVQDVGFEPVSL
jgi:hypothetical protein